MCDQHCECVCESALPSLPPDFEAMDNLFQPTSFPLFGPRVDCDKLERIERNAHLARRVLKAADDISNSDPHPGKIATILQDLAREFEKETTRGDLNQLAGTDPESIAKRQERCDEARRQWYLTREEHIKQNEQKWEETLSRAKIEATGRGLFQALKPDDEDPTSWMSPEGRKLFQSSSARAACEVPVPSEESESGPPCQQFAIASGEPSVECHWWEPRGTVSDH